jgi:ATP-binding cassette, subfamily B, bacterial IrtB/YbtQ
MTMLPLGWFNRETVGHVSQIAVKGTVFVGTSGANLITPVVLNSTSAATVVVGLFVYDWRTVWSRWPAVCCWRRAGGSRRV